MGWLNPDVVKHEAGKLKAQLDAKEIKPSQYNEELGKLIQKAESGGFGDIQMGGANNPFFQALKRDLEGMKSNFQDDVAGEVRPEINEDARRFQEWAESAQEREAWQAQFDPTGQEQQQYALGLHQEAAFGLAPSKAELMLGRGMDQSINDQYAMAASARGGGASQALAMRQAQMGAAGLQQDYATQQAGLRAEEMANARQAYMQGATGLRDSDYNQTMAQAGLEMQQRQMNDAAMMGMTGYETGQKNVGYGLMNSDANRRNEVTITDMNNKTQKEIARGNKPSDWDKALGAAQGGFEMVGTVYPPAKAGGAGVSTVRKASR